MIGRRTAAAAAAMSAAGAAAAAYARFVEPKRLRLPAHELTLPRWPLRLDGLRVAVVCDLHAGGPNAQLPHLRALVDAVNAARPELVALCGDYGDPTLLGGDRVHPAAIAQELARLTGTAGVVAVLGNHDWAHEGHLMAGALRAAGLTVLENDAVRLQARDGPLWIAGLGDERTRGAFAGEALAAVPAHEPVIVLSHDPDAFPYVPARAALTVSGHLHGGQVNLPLIARRVMPTRHGSRYKAGHVVEQGRHLFVSRGVGESTLPIRIRATPEVPLLTLRSE